MLIAKYVILSGIVPHGVHGVNEVRCIQRFLNKHFGCGEYRIHIFEKIKGEIKKIWTSSIPSLRNIVLLKCDSYFKRIDSMSSLFRNKYYCFDCTGIVCRKISHSCDYICRCCSRSSLICKPDVQVVLIHCSECGVSFSSRSCYFSHLKSQSSGQKRCGIVCFCNDCGKFFNKKHLNGEVIFKYVYCIC